MRFNGLIIAFIIFFTFKYDTKAQTVERERPAEWNNLVYGGRFMDRFLPMPNIGMLTRDTWGAEDVLPRYTNNGIENRQWSFWGGNIKLGEDGKFHFFVCGWREDSPKGHNTWPNSTVFHAVSDNSIGPYVVKDTIGKGHNPEVFRLKDGRYVIYVIGGYYIAKGVNGPWTYGQFKFLNRDCPLIEGNSNFTFAQREDGSYLMICRGGGQWFSQTGLSSYSQVTGNQLSTDHKIIPSRAYPPIQGNFEDPVVWRDNIQYNLIVNDWLGRIAFYERSKDGVNWIVESGEAYIPGIAKHEDGTVEGWFKFERLKIFQDQFGRATQANFAVIDAEKKYDKASDNHSSKNISIPLTVGRLLTILDKKQITSDTKKIRVRITSEKGFNPQTDIDIGSLRFGGPEAVNYGKGSSVLKTEKSGKDLIVIFNGEGNGIPDDEFAAKLLGKTNTGKLLFGYARLPWINFIEPILSARMPEITRSNDGFKLNVEVQNFGQVASKNASIKIMVARDQEYVEVANAMIPRLKPFQKTNIEFKCGKLFDLNVFYDLAVNINSPDKKPVTLHVKVTPSK